MCKSRARPSPRFITWGRLFPGWQWKSGFQRLKRSGFSCQPWPQVTRGSPAPPDAHPRQLGLQGEGSWETRTALETPGPTGLTEWGDWSWEGQPPLGLPDKFQLQIYNEEFLVLSVSHPIFAILFFICMFSAKSGTPRSSSREGADGLRGGSEKCTESCSSGSRLLGQGAHRRGVEGRQQAGWGVRGWGGGSAPPAQLQFP